VQVGLAGDAGQRGQDGDRQQATQLRTAEESLGRLAAENRHDVELALRASHWLGASVLQQVTLGQA
jgi:hypothetical protein